MAGEAQTKRQRLPRRARVFLVEFVLAALVGGATVALLAIASVVLPASWQDTLNRGLIEGVHSLLKLDTLAPYASQIGVDLKALVRLFFKLVLFGAIVGLLFKAGLLRALAERIYDALLAPYDDTILRPIRRPRAIDPLRGTLGTEGEEPFAWQARPGSARAAVFEKLRHFARYGDGYSHQNARAEFIPFRFVLVMGLPGSGKSRLAMEAARELAQRDVWSRKGALRSWLGGMAVRWRAFRSRSTFRDGDPWDAGWLAGPEARAEEDAATPCTTWEARQQMRDTPWNAELKAWRPRRPTVLLLDDPQPGDAGAVVSALHTAAADEASPYRHAVRLIIVSPAPPDDLQCPPDMRRKVWSSRNPAPKAPPIVLGEAERFDAGDIRTAAQIFGGSNNPLWRSEAVNHLLDITQGNPLLVEIAFSVLRRARAARRGLVLADLTAEALMSERVLSWSEVLDNAGVGAPGRKALTAATLAGDAPPERLDAVLGRDASPKPETLRKLFPGAAFAPGSAVPPLRPTLIGDAFARAVVAECNPNRAGGNRSEAEDVIAAAWVANPPGMLDTVLRLAGTDDALSRLLALDPLADLHLDRDGAGFDAATLAQTWALAAVRVPRAVWEAGDFAKADGLFRDAERRIVELPPQVAAAGLQGFAEALPLTNGAWIVRGRKADRLIHAWLGRALEHPAAWRGPDGLERLFALERQLWALAEAWGVTDWDDEGDSYKALRQAYAWAVEGAELGGVNVPLAEAMRELERAVEANRTHARTHAVATFEGLARARRKAGDAIPAARLSARSFFCAHKPDACCEAVAQIKRLAAGREDDREVAEERVRAWRYLIGVKDLGTAVGREAVDAVERLAAFYAGDRDFALERAKTWADLVNALEKDVAGCQEAVARVDAIAEPFAGDREFALIQTTAWRYLSYALAQVDAAACRDAVAVVDTLSAPFAGDRDFAYQQVTAWRYLAFALAGDATARREAVARVNAIAAPFVGHRAFAHEQAGAWQSLSFELHGNAAFCREAVNQVDALAAPFAAERDFALLQAGAWSYLAGALGADAAACREAVARVDTIVAPFAKERDFILEQAIAWRSLAVVRRHDADACREAVTHVDTLAARFAKDREFVLERVRAWRVLVYALMDDVAACREAVERVDVLAEPFAEERDFAFEQAQAWRYLAYELRNNDAPACCEAVARVDDLAAPFALDPEFLLERAVAWKHYAFAVRDDRRAFAAAIAELERIYFASGCAPQILERLSAARRCRDDGFPGQGAPGFVHKFGWSASVKIPVTITHAASPAGDIAPATPPDSTE